MKEQKDDGPVPRKRVLVSRDDLPVHCPLEKGPGGVSDHPRVYLPLDEVDQVRCPYCGTEYVIRS